LSKFASNPGSGLLIASGWMSVAASLLHIGCIIGGPDWYRFFGAGEQMAKMAERGLCFAIGAWRAWAVLSQK
jgi:hypothetical protein